MTVKLAERRIFGAFETKITKNAMPLYEYLQSATSEEDVKDLYIKALGLKAYKKNLIDIQTEEIWFEAKDGYRHSTYEMFTQLLHYVQVALDT